MNKKLATIAVGRAPGQVSVSFLFDGAPADHFIIPVNVASDLRNRLSEALAMLDQSPGRPGDAVELSDVAKVQIS